MSKKDAIHGFVQIIYAFVIGFGFFQIKVSDINFDAEVDWEIIFNIALYIFTFILAAHDWLEYHKKELTDKINFARALPQMFSLLSIGFMFLHSTYNDLLLWSMGGVSLTVFNLLGLVFASETKKKWDWIPSSIFIAISIGVFAWICVKLYHQNKMIEFKIHYFIWLAILEIVVYAIWTFKYLSYGKTKEVTITNQRRQKLEAKLTELQNNYNILTTKYKTDLQTLSSLQEAFNSKISEIQTAKNQIEQKFEALKAQISKG